MFAAINNKNNPNMKNLLLLILACLPFFANAKDNKKDDNSNPKYLEGAITFKDDKIVFEDEIKVPSMKKEELYSTMLQWAEKRFVSEGKLNSRVVYKNEGKGEIVASAEETDDMALNKKKTKLAPICGKFRRETIDLKDALFASARECLGQKILDTPSSSTVSPNVEKKTGVVAVSELPENLAQMATNGKITIKANGKETQLDSNSWGGFGKLFNKDVAYILIDKKQSEICKNMESSPSYTVSFYKDKSSKAEIVIECKKTMTQELSTEELKSLNQNVDTNKEYIMYICEVTSAVINQ